MTVYDVYDLNKLTVLLGSSLMAFSLCNGSKPVAPRDALVVGSLNLRRELGRALISGKKDYPVRFNSPVFASSVELDSCLASFEA